MANKHKPDDFEVKELKLGASFTEDDPSTQYHTVKYDFKPASVDERKMATVDVATNNEVTITVPHLDGAGVPQTVFKGSQKPYTKECVVIIDHNTGEITLEKLSSNIQVKKTRGKTSVIPQPISQKSTHTNMTRRSSTRGPIPSGKSTNHNSSGNFAKTKNPTELGIGTAFGSEVDGTGPSSLVLSMPRLQISQPVSWHHPIPWTGGGESTDEPLPNLDVVSWHHPSPWTGSGDITNEPLPILDFAQPSEPPAPTPIFSQQSSDTHSLRYMQPRPLEPPALTPPFSQQPSDSHSLQKLERTSPSPTTIIQAPPPSSVDRHESLADNNSPVSSIADIDDSDDITEGTDSDISPPDWLHTLLRPLPDDEVNSEPSASQPGNNFG